MPSRQSGGIIPYHYQSFQKSSGGRRDSISGACRGLSRRPHTSDCAPAPCGRRCNAGRVSVRTDRYQSWRDCTPKRRRRQGVLTRRRGFATTPPIVTKCQACGRQESWPLTPAIGRIRLELCRRCGGSLCQFLIRGIRDFDRKHPRPKKPKNPASPIIDPNRTVRCRKCEVALHDWKEGDSPLCPAC